MPLSAGVCITTLSSYLSNVGTYSLPYVLANAYFITSLSRRDAEGDRAEQLAAWHADKKKRHLSLHQQVRKDLSQAKLTRQLLVDDWITSWPPLRGFAPQAASAESTL